MYSRLKDDIFAAHLAEIGTLSSFNRGVKHLLCMIDIFNRYVWVKPFTDKKAKTVMVLLK